jgi:protein-serine/threonine kinase
MVVGIPPYFSANKNDLMANITKGKLKIPTFLTMEAKELIKDVRNIQLLQRDPQKRLGAIRDAEEIKQHRFFKGIDWSAVAEKQLKTHKINIPDVPNCGPNVESVFGLGQANGGPKVNGWSFVCN